MTTKLQSTIRREVTINDVGYTLVISPEGLSIVKKRGRNAKPVTWAKIHQLIDLEGAAE